MMKTKHISLLMFVIFILSLLSMSAGAQVNTVDNPHIVILLSDEIVDEFIATTNTVVCLLSSVEIHAEFYIVSPTKMGFNSYDTFFYVDYAHVDSPYLASYRPMLSYQDRSVVPYVFKYYDEQRIGLILFNPVILEYDDEYRILVLLHEMSHMFYDADNIGLSLNKTEEINYYLFNFVRYGAGSTINNWDCTATPLELPDGVLDDMPQQYAFSFVFIHYAPDTATWLDKRGIEI